MSFRKEEKIACTKYEKQNIFRMLKSQGMVPLHSSRVIRSTYYDNTQLDSFHDSEEGILPRKKIRIREYPYCKPGFTLELKVSSVEGRYKTSHAIPLMNVNKLCETGYSDCKYGLCKPKVIVEYERMYFSLGGIRVTFDQNICYTCVKSSIKHRDQQCVVELKAPMFMGNDYLLDLVDMPRARFSKYSRAVLLSNAQHFPA